MAMYYVLILNFVTMLVYGIDKFRLKREIGEYLSLLCSCWQYLEEVSEPGLV